MNTQSRSPSTSPSTEAAERLRRWLLVHAGDGNVALLDAAVEAARAKGRREAVREIENGSRRDDRGRHIVSVRLLRQVEGVAGLNASESPPELSDRMTMQALADGDMEGDASESGQPPEASDE